MEEQRTNFQDPPKVYSVHCKIGNNKRKMVDKKKTDEEKEECVGFGNKFRDKYDEIWQEEDQGFKCGLCDKIYSSSKKVSHDWIFAQEKCDKEYVCRKELEIHIRNEHKGRQYKSEEEDG